MSSPNNSMLRTALRASLKRALLVLQPCLWGLAMSRSEGPLEPSAPIVTVACLLPFGPAPSQPRQTQFRRIRRQW